MRRCFARLEALCGALEGYARIEEHVSFADDTSVASDYQRGKAHAFHATAQSLRTALLGGKPDLLCAGITQGYERRRIEMGFKKEDEK